MNPLKRKMFMQQGGMVPQQMMPPPPQQQMMAPPQQMMPPAEMPMAPGPEEVMAEAQRQEGDELVSGILSQVDSAQDYEQLMNAIRGDEVPVEGRRDELAGLVGEPDAKQTPDSVLTLVQPTMAIVEAQGGLDALMQGEADIAMEDESGMPTDMAGGVGSMLMAGQPEEPVQMADGGMVRKMQKGSAYGSFRPNAFNIEPMTDLKARSLQDIYAELLPTFQTGIGQPDKDVARAQALASIGGAGLRLAQGSRQPGANFLSDLAGAFAPVPGEITAIAGQASEADRAARMGALQTASGIYQEEQKDIREQQGKERILSLDNMFGIGLTEFKANIAKKVQESAQDHQTRLANDVNALQQYIAELNSSTELNKTQMINDANQKLQVLKGEQEQAKIAVMHENTLARDSVLQGYNERNMKLDFNNKSELLSQKTLAEKLLQAERLEQQQQQFTQNYNLKRDELEQVKELTLTGLAEKSEQFFAQLNLDKEQLKQIRTLAREEMDLKKELTELGIDGQITLQGLKDRTSKELLGISQALEYDKLKLEAAELGLISEELGLTDPDTNQPAITARQLGRVFEKYGTTDRSRIIGFLSDPKLTNFYAKGGKGNIAQLYESVLLDNLDVEKVASDGSRVLVPENLTLRNAQAIIQRQENGQMVTPKLVTAAEKVVEKANQSTTPGQTTPGQEELEGRISALKNLAKSFDPSDVPKGFLADFNAGVNAISRFVGGPVTIFEDANTLNRGLKSLEGAYNSVMSKSNALLIEVGQGGGTTTIEKFEEYLPEEIGMTYTYESAGRTIKETTLPFIKTAIESLKVKLEQEEDPSKVDELITTMNALDNLSEAYRISADAFLYGKRETTPLANRTKNRTNPYKNIIRNNMD